MTSISNSSPVFFLREAVPIIVKTLFFLSRCDTPEDNCLATFRDRSTIFFISKVIFSALKPKASRLSRMWPISEDFSNAFVGIHPQFKQTPPKFSRSTIATLSPSCDALIAAT